MTEHRLLLCTDMDRTVIPNGPQPEHPEARKRFAAFCRRPDVTLAYVTGRHRALVRDAIREYALPEPDFAITDVGTVIYRVTDGTWEAWDAWAEEISRAWNGKTHADIVALLGDLPHLTLQEPDKQNTHKVSFYLSASAHPEDLMARMQERLAREGVEAGLIWSVDESEDVGLLDVLPRDATKRHAVEFLQRELRYSPDEVVFAGDSGNDLPVMESVLPSVLVANASDEVKERARVLAQRSDDPEAFYIARGGVLNMNGNYCAGVLEGVWHFVPAFRDVLEESEDAQ